MRKLPLIGTAAMLIATVTACGQRPPAEWTLAPQKLESPAGATSSEPQLSVSSKGVLLSWIERVGTTTILKFAERTASGWTQPMTAASGEKWFLSYADVPSVQRMTNGTLIAQYLPSTNELLEAYDLVLTYSKDEGKTWSAPFMPHHDGMQFQHGFASMVDMPGGGLGIVWLDGRNSEFKDEDPASGTMTMRFASFDAHWKQTADLEIDHRVCECCQTTAVTTTDGVLTAFRDRDDQEVRDIAVSRFEGGKWTPPAIVSKDNWMIDGCPVNGPSMSARGRDVAVAWFTVKDDVGLANVAFSSDAGRTWGPPIRVDDKGSLGRVDVELLDDGSALVSWVEYADGASDFKVRRVEKSGTKSAAIGVAAVSGGRASGFPRMARNGNELIFAWSGSATPEGDAAGSLQVFTAVATLP
ncbi:MAG: exo-alpha-sialidase [Acidobacteria bacterium]|nr:exo-alpha-sialidase [Acidobacteriota bacterium]